MSKQFTAYNGPAPTTAAITAQTTGTAIKTMLQLATPSTLGLEVVGWGISFSGTTFGTKITCELIDTDVAATGLSALAATTIVKATNPAAESSNLTFGTGATGYATTAPTEGTITASRPLDVQLVDQSAAYSLIWPLGNYPRVALSRFLRVRVTASAAVNAICWVTWQES